MLARLLDDPITVRVLVVAPHPDDETIGAGIALGRMQDVQVLHLTDGAPLERRFWTAECATREAYAELRHAEALAALQLANVPGRCVHPLGFADQTLTEQLVELVRHLAATFREHAPDLVLTTPYEGAHPDHDAAAFACRAALATLPREAGAPALLEMTSYHLHDGALRAGRFLDDRADTVTVVPTPEELARKARMLAAFASQAAMLGHFGTGSETFRNAPTYDFTRAPHCGPLFYEAIGIPVSGDVWRSSAARALATLQHDSGACAS